MKKSDFHYHLPPELIAQQPLAERSASRLLLVPPGGAPFSDRQVRELPELLQPGDLLLCCGKGHEKFMKKNGTKVPFDEEARIREALGRRGITIS